MFIVGAIGLLFGIYIYFQVRGLEFVDRIAGEKKWKKNLLPAAILLVLMGIGYLINMTLTVVIVIHIILFLLIVNVIAAIIKKTADKKINAYVKCAVALALTAIYLTYGYINDNTIQKTTYNITSNKELSDSSGKKINSLKIAQITDTHLGTTFDGDEFADYIKDIQAQNPDMVVVTGDLVDDDTSKEDMVKACQALGSLKTKYGVYYITGNHDPSYFYDREYNMADLQRTLENNGVVDLIDQTKLVDDAFYVVGRMDRRFDKQRASMKKLTEPLIEGKYMIVLDHQPHDYKAQQKVGADLVLSGHTHGGQMFPLGLFGELSGVNEQTYGLEKRGKTNFIVSSGMSGWGVPFKTAAKSEYVIINVKFK